MVTYDHKTIADLIDGKLPSWKLIEMMRSHKDPERFASVLAVWQERVPWPERILLPLALNLFIVQKGGGDRIVKCTCGQEFGDYRRNWKLEALIFVRDSDEKFNEVYPKYMGPDPAWMEMREYYCPGCLTLLDVEAVPPGYPVVFEFLPDLESFYRDWLGKPLE